MTTPYIKDTPLSLSYPIPYCGYSHLYQFDTKSSAFFSQSR